MQLTVHLEKLRVHDSTDVVHCDVYLLAVGTSLVLFDLHYRDVSIG